MKFLFDLDDTLVSGDIILEVSRKMMAGGALPRLYSNSDLTTYDLRDLPEILKSKVKQAFADPDYVWVKRPIVGSYFFLLALETLGHETGILTARPMSIARETKRFLEARYARIKFSLGLNMINTENKIDMDKVPTKKDRLEEIRPDFYFDDNVEYCLQASELNIETFLISNKNTPWNNVFAKETLTLVSPVSVLRNVAFFPETRL